MSRSLVRIVVLALSIAAVLGHEAHADWRDDHRVFRVGVVVSSGAAYDVRRLEPFRAYLESWMPMPVELVPMTTYAALVDAHVRDGVQYAIHTATSFAAAYATCQCVDAVAVPAASNGARGFFSVLFVRADSGIADIAGARGLRLAVSAADSVTGRLIPFRFLEDTGIDVAGYFSEIVETPGPYAAVEALLGGAADVAVGWSSLTGDAAQGYDFGVLAEMVRDGAITADQVYVIWQSPLIPFGPHAVRAELPPEIRRQVNDALAAMAADDPAALDAVDRASFGGGGFVPITTDDYAAVAELIGGFDRSGGRSEARGSD